MEATGLDAAREMFEADLASRSLGIELLELAEGLAVTSMRVTAAMVNGHAIGHGGYVFLLADTTFPCACNSHGPVTVAAMASITFLAPVAEGDLLTATRAVRPERHLRRNRPARRRGRRRVPRPQPHTGRPRSFMIVRAAAPESGLADAAL